jgi:hypothetical protein
MLLINPPISKPSEPHAGIARLSGALFTSDIKHHVLDASIEGIYYLLEHGSEPSDTWTRRAAKALSRNLDALKNRDLYHNLDRYKRAVIDVNRVLEMSASGKSVQLSLADFQHNELTPVKSADLIYAALHPEENLFYPYFSKRLAHFVEAEGITTAGFSINYLSLALTAFAMIGFLRRQFQSIKILAGGGLITSWMQNPGWKNPFGAFIDHIAAGPGESALLEILGKKASKKTLYRPAYDLLPLKSYLSPGLVLPYSTSSGCYWSDCSFCPEKSERNEYVQIRPDRVIDDLIHLKNQYNPAMIHFTDNALGPAMMRRIAGASLDVPWYGFVRITRHLTDPEFCRALRGSGCVLLKLGLESGNQGILDYMNKGCDLKTAAATLKTLHDSGIATYVYLLFGTPSETILEAKDTLDFVVENSENIDFLNLAIFNLPINSVETKEVKTMDFYEGDLSLYRDFKHHKGWGRREVRQFLEKEFKKHPAIQQILRRQPPFFTSNHAAFFAVGDMRKGKSGTIIV